MQNTILSLTSYSNESSQSNITNQSFFVAPIYWLYKNVFSVNISTELEAWSSGVWWWKTLLTDVTDGPIEGKINRIFLLASLKMVSKSFLSEKIQKNYYNFFGWWVFAGSRFSRKFSVFFCGFREIKSKESS